MEPYNIEHFKKNAEKVLDECKIKQRVELDNKVKELILRVPSGDMKYKSFWIRDAAMMAASGLISVEEVEGWLEFIACKGQTQSEEIKLKNSLNVPAWSIADHINFDGAPVYYPGTYSSGNDQGNGGFGYYPPHDDQYYFIEIAYEYYKCGGDLNFLCNEVNGISYIERLENAFRSYNIDTKTQLCISTLPYYTVDWGFCDQITKSGYLLFPSLLRYRAALRLNNIFESLSDTEKKDRYLRVANQLKVSIKNTFYHESGWLVSATETCRQKDIWGTCFAIWMDLLDEPYKSKSIAALADEYLNGTSISNGYVRHIREDEDASQGKSAWENTFCPYNTYQNGGYWCVPTGWYAYALAQQNRDLADKLIGQFISHWKSKESLGAPFEWISKDGLQYEGKRYGASAALPHAAVLRLSDIDIK